MKLILRCLLVTLMLSCAVPAHAASSLVTTTARDGRKDFDFLFGTWHTHYMRLRHVLQNDHEWYGCDGTSTVRPFWRGNANLEDGDLRCPQQYIRGMTVRLYNPATHQWSLWWGTEKAGLTEPPQVGHFDANGVGLFYADDTWHGRPIVVRYKWSVMNGRPHFEQAFSVNHGKTWETNWTTVYTH
jgi:hypothetical protein